jgi:hypothetical protein
MEFDNLELFHLHRKLHEKAKEVCTHGWGPEAKDFEVIKKDILSYIAYKIWEKKNKPTNCDMMIWLEAETIWNFLRYMWD